MEEGPEDEGSSRLVISRKPGQFFSVFIHGIECQIEVVRIVNSNRVMIAIHGDPKEVAIVREERMQYSQ